MRLKALVMRPSSIERWLRALGEPTDSPLSRPHAPRRSSKAACSEENSAGSTHSSRCSGRSSQVQLLENLALVRASVWLRSSFGHRPRAGAAWLGLRTAARCSMARATRTPPRCADLSRRFQPRCPTRPGQAPNAGAHFTYALGSRLHCAHGCAHVPSYKTLVN